MPELPDVVVYTEALTSTVVNRTLERLSIPSPFVLRSVTPPIQSVVGQEIRGIRRIGKRIVLTFGSDLFLVVHLMIAGRLRWRERGRKLGLGPKIVLASFEFAHGTLWLTEAGSKKRASMQLVQGEGALNALNPGGVEPLQITNEQFLDALTRENHTVKRALTDPHLFSGIGNAYSDEILHAARLSPLKLTRTLADEEVSPALRGDPSHASSVDRTSAARSQGRVSGESHGFPRRDGGPRPLQAAVSGLRNAGAANRVRRQRVQLLRSLPDGRPSARRSCDVASARRRLASHHRRVVVYDRSTGREGSLAHSLHDPAYNLAPRSPACSSATRF